MAAVSRQPNEQARVSEEKARVAGFNQRYPLQKTFAEARAPLSPSRVGPCRRPHLGALPPAQDPISDLPPAEHRSANFFKISISEAPTHEPTLLESLLKRTTGAGPQFQFSIFLARPLSATHQKKASVNPLSGHASKTIGLGLKSSIGLPVNGSSSRHGIG